MIQIQNYYKGSLHFENGLPLTTKKNKRDHGYGMKSIEKSAKKYGGICHWEYNEDDKTFHFNIIFNDIDISD